MKKAAAQILTVLLLVAALTGCGRSRSGPEPTAAPTATAAFTPEPTATAPAPETTPTPEPTAAPTPTASPTATPTATPTAVPTAAPTPVPEKPFVSKHPSPAAVSEGGSCTFEADYINAIWAVWHFVSPDGQTDLTYEQIGSRFPNMQVVNGMYSKMELRNVPLSANGWKVYCRYTNNGGSTDTGMALLTVTAAVTPGSFPVAGTYVDSIAGRATMEISGTSVHYNVTVIWPNSASETVTFTFSGAFDQSGVMRYTDGIKVTTAYDTGGNGTSTTNYTGGAGTLTYSPAGDSLAWNDGSQTQGTFVRPQPAPPVNGWIETADLQTAIGNAGVSFSPPVPQALPAGTTLTAYRSCTGIIEARYDDGALTIRKSNIVSGSDLSGDYNVYSQTWDITLKGLGVHCRGNGANVNEATFRSGEYSYSILYHAGQEGAGLTPDQINSIVNGMS